MNREELLMRAALASRGSTRWQHTEDVGWSEVPFSPQNLERMSDTELEGLIESRARSHGGLVEWARNELPEFDPASDANPVEIGFCHVCSSSIEETSEAFMAWDDALSKWVLYCARHRPSHYWRCGTGK